MVDDDVLIVGWKVNFYYPLDFLQESAVVLGLLDSVAEIVAPLLQHELGAR